jgi:4-hydroxy-4-methyl-2-oxoglutarate aldolase
MSCDLVIQRLARLDSCAVSDALDKLRLSGTVVGLLPMTVARKIAGRVLTVKLEAQSEGAAPSGPPVHLGARAIEQAERGDIIAVEQSTGIVAGCWGGILSVGAKMRGIAGVIAEGLIRDVDEARGIEFPVYARGATSLTARGRVRERETGGTITVSGVSVSSGDYALADSTGTVFVPKDQAEAILTVAEQIASREFAMAADLIAGASITTVMGHAYERMLTA